MMKCPNCGTKMRNDVCEDIGLDAWVCPNNDCQYATEAWK